MGQPVKQLQQTTKFEKDLARMKRRGVDLRILQQVVRRRSGAKEKERRNNRFAVRYGLYDKPWAACS